MLNGVAWGEFCDTLKAAGASMLAPGAPQDAFSQAEGYRYLARLARAGLENFVECTDVEAPQLCAIANGGRAARICIGSDNPDNLYENATIDSALEYVLLGTRGTVGYLGVGTQSGQYGQAGGLQTVAYLEGDEIVYDNLSHGQRPSGESTFSIVLSAVRPDDATNWLRLEPCQRAAMCMCARANRMRPRHAEPCFTADAVALSCAVCDRRLAIEPRSGPHSFGFSGATRQEITTPYRNHRPSPPAGWTRDCKRRGCWWLGRRPCLPNGHVRRCRLRTYL